MSAMDTRAAAEDARLRRLDLMMQILATKRRRRAVIEANTALKRE